MSAGSVELAAGQLVQLSKLHALASPNNQVNKVLKKVSNQKKKSLLNKYICIYFFKFRISSSLIF